MQPHDIAYFYAVAAAFCFASASLGFSYFAKKFSSVWMNFLKSLVCSGILLVIVLGFQGWQPLRWEAQAALFISGVLGLGIGDIFLMQSFARMGVARTLILFGFQPLFIGVASWYFFDQAVDAVKFISVLFFVGCLWTFSLEKYREEGRWEILGLAAALLGVIFDNTGVILTRWSFNMQPDMGALQANLVRCVGATLFFVVTAPLFKPQLLKGFKSLTGREKSVALAASFGGTFLSLYLYLTAIRIGHLASLSAVGVAGPLISALLECLYLKRWPSSYLIVALAFFLSGFSILIFL